MKPWRSMLFAMAFAGAATAQEAFVSASIDGGGLRMDAWSGWPGLVANTASRCALTPRCGGRQALHDRCRDHGLVLAVPPDDFDHELETEGGMTAFCEPTRGRLPMAEIPGVRGEDAHPFDRRLGESCELESSCGYFKALIGRQRECVDASTVLAKPLSRDLVRAVESSLGG